MRARGWLEIIASHIAIYVFVFTIVGLGMRMCSAAQLKVAFLVMLLVVFPAASITYEIERRRAVKKNGMQVRRQGHRRDNVLGKNMSVREIAIILKVAVRTALRAAIGSITGQGYKTIRHSCGYFGATGRFMHEVEGYLNGCYQEHSIYPEKLDISKFAVFNEDGLREIAETIEYSTDGNSFEVVWKYPVAPPGTDSFGVWTCKGTAGQRMVWNVELATGNGKGE